MAHLVLALALGSAVLEGALRKWVIEAESGIWSYLAYFSKDIFFAGLLLLPRRSGTTPALELFGKFLAVGGCLLTLGGVIASCQGWNLVGAALTLRATIILPAIAYAAVSRLSGYRLLPMAVLLAVGTCINCGLGLAQNHLPADHALNRYAISQTDVAALESGVRATGTFAYITGLALLSSIGIWAGVVMLSLGRGALCYTGGIMTILAGVVCALATISRGPLLIGGLVLAGWACLARPGRAEISGILVMVVAVAMTMDLVTGARKMATAVAERHEEGGDSFRQRVFGQLSQAVVAASVVPLGRGLGTEQVAANYAATGAMKFTTFEEQLPRLVLETGVLGVLGFITVCSGAICSLQQARRNQEDRRARAVLLSTQVLLGCMFYTNVVFNHTASAFAWMLFAAVMASLTSLNPSAPLAPEPPFRNHFRRTRFAR